MPHRGLLIPLLLVSLSVGLRAEEPAIQPPDVVVLDVVGEVEFQRAPKQNWVVAERGMQFGQGAKLCTGVGGEAILACGSTCLVRVGEATVFEVRSIRQQGPELDVQFHVDPGLARVLVRILPDLSTHAEITRPRLTCSVNSGRSRVIDPTQPAEAPPPPPPIMPIVLDCAKGEDDASRERARNAFGSFVDGWDQAVGPVRIVASRRAVILMDQVVLLEAGYPDLAAFLGYGAKGDDGPPGFFARVEWGVLSCREGEGQVRQALDRLLKASPNAASLRGK